LERKRLACHEREGESRLGKTECKRGLALQSKKGRGKYFLDDLSNSAPVVRLYGEGRQLTRPKLKIEDRYRRKNHAAISGC